MESNVTMITKKLFDKVIRVTSIRWHQVLKDLNSLKAFLLKITLCVCPRMSKEYGIASFLLSKNLYRLGRKSGWLHCSIYCKYASTCLQQFYGGDAVKPQPFPISLTRCGLPKIIPSFHREMIRKRDDRADTIVRFYLSAFSLAKVIPLAPRVSANTFKTIVTPLTPEQEISVANFCELFTVDLPELVRRYLPKVDKIPLQQGIRWKPSWKALPNYAVSRVLSMDRSPFVYLPLELKVFGSNLNFIHSYGTQHSPLMLWLDRVRFAFDSLNEQACFRDLAVMEVGIAPYPINCEGPAKALFRFGRLGQSCEGRAKRRIFAIGNFVNQCLLRPVHDWAMEVLTTIPMDGTFNQSKPLRRLVGSTYMASVDLSAATDRFPLRFIFHLVATLFGESFASSVVNSTLATNSFEVPFTQHKLRVKDPLEAAAKQNCVCFVVGQPLGYYSSWPLFALTHHAVVWWAANRVYPGRTFRRYALLGDDIVIADQAVAQFYKAAMGMMGVSVSPLKSLESHTGSCEFAKQFWVKKCSVDLSPVSMKLLLGCHHPRGLMALSVKYPQLTLNKLLAVHGLGYKSRGKVGSGVLSKRNVRLMALLARQNLPLDLWMGVYNPYVLGSLVDKAFAKSKPRDFKTAPEALIGDNPQARYADLVEITLYRGAMLDYLQYLNKYWELYNQAYFLGVNPWVVLDGLLKLKPIHRDWKPNQTDDELIRFGLAFKLYDLANVLVPPKAITQGERSIEILPETIYLGPGNPI